MNRGNTRSRLRRSPGRMDDHDRLPPDLRRWITQAPLPFSAASALRLWLRAMRRTGDPAAAQAALDARAHALIARDAARIWGPDHPAAQG